MNGCIEHSPIPVQKQKEGEQFKKLLLKVGTEREDEADRRGKGEEKESWKIGKGGFMKEELERKYQPCVKFLCQELY